MSQVSRYKLKGHQENKLVESLIFVLSSVSSKSEMTRFLSTFLTETEKVMLAKRLAIIYLVYKGNNDAEISRSLNVTRITVSKMRYFYELHKLEFTIAIRKIEEEKSLAEIRQFLISLTRYAVRAAGGRVKPTIL